VIASQFRRPVAAALLVGATVFAAALPPAHIHLGADHDDHDQTAGIEHSHWAAHQGSGSAFDDDDGRVLFVNHSALIRAARGPIQQPDVAVVGALLAADSPTFTFSNQRLAGNATRDGPERDPSTLRGPPFVL
jgi:hypothetical protein